MEIVYCDLCMRQIAESDIRFGVPGRSNAYRCEDCAKAKSTAADATGAVAAPPSGAAPAAPSARKTKSARIAAVRRRAGVPRSAIYAALAGLGAAIAAFTAVISSRGDGGKKPPRGIVLPAVAVPAAHPVTSEPTRPAPRPASRPAPGTTRSGPETGREASTTPATVPGGAIKINFQTTSAPAPAGYLVDAGEPFGDRGNGHAYGWNKANRETRERKKPTSPDKRYDTLNHMQKRGASTWEIAVPNGRYAVRVVAGDASHHNSVYRIAVEGVLTVDGEPNSKERWIEGASTVTVSDGRLTVSSAAGSRNNKICFIEVTRGRIGQSADPNS